ncbi:MAG: DNA translocase FtsK [Clostridiales bacterium]|nr:DNA translocase FtsK [Clostridiales bacterium]
MSSSKKSSKKKNTRSSGKGSAKKNISSQLGYVGGEISIWIVLAICILLLISNFGFGGAAGAMLSKLFFGLFGTLAYVMPFILFLITTFLVANGNNARATIKGIAFGVFLILLSGVIQLFSIPFNKNARIMSYYAYSGTSHKGGGLFGGMMMKIMYPSFGKIGAFIVMFIMMVICFILITEKTILRRLGLVRNYPSRGDNKRDKAIKKEEFRGSYTGGMKDTALPKEKAAEKNEDLRSRRESLKTRGRKSRRGNNEILPKTEVLQEKITTPTAEENLSGVNISFANRDGKNSADIKEMHPETPDVPEIPAPKTKAVNKKERKEAESEIAREITQNDSVRESVQDYRIPPLDLLEKGDNGAASMSEDDVKSRGAKLISTLLSFGVKAKLSDISVGPTVTRYELIPEVGVKVRKILDLSDDIKLNLAVPDIRIEAPIPGKAAIGIEVPNSTNASIRLRDLLEKPEFKKSKSKISFAVGMDIGGKTIVADIYNMPHLLIGGATGSGKSVCINTLIMSILYKAKPDEVKFIMIDPKMIELGFYNGIPHLLVPVVTDPKKAAGALSWACGEMMRRYKLFQALFVRDLKSYNAKVEKLIEEGESGEEYKKMPQIVIVVDEFADLMMVASGEVEDAVCRLAQLARAAGIHLILATQRPSVDVITGLIKANMPSRIALSVASGTDSRTIIGTVGAEKLLGKGDMLFSTSSFPKPVRIQGAYVSETEVERVVEYIKSSAEAVEYDESVQNQIDANANGQGISLGNSGALESGDSRDEYFEQAARLIVEKDKASIGMLQRALKIGFNRAARIMDSLAEAGIVGEEEGTKPRKILMSMDELENYFADN